MTTQSIRIACAEECGYRKLAQPRAFNFMWAPGHISRREGDWEDQHGNVMSEDCIPDHPSDANAALSLVTLLAKEGWHWSAEDLIDGNKVEFMFYRPKNDRTLFANLGHRGGLLTEKHYGAADTLAGAVCECFLRVKSRWVEDKP